MEGIGYRFGPCLSVTSVWYIWLRKSTKPATDLKLFKPSLAIHSHSNPRRLIHRSQHILTTPRFSHPRTNATMTTPLPPKKPFTGDPKQYSPDHFSKSISATCLCGSISVTINEDIFALPDIYLCHCANCRKVSGSYVAPNLRIAKEKVEIEDRKGTMKTYEDWETGSGNKVERTFCSGCGS